MKNRLLLVLFVLIFTLSTALTGCGSQSTSGSADQTENTEAQQQSSGRDYQDITPETLKQMISNENDLVIVDVREKEEFAEGHIAGAQLVPLSEFQSRVNELPKDKKVVLVCLSGSRSSQAAAYLVQLGYNQVFNLDGGMSVWPFEISDQ